MYNKFNIDSKYQFVPCEVSQAAKRRVYETQHNMIIAYNVILQIHYVVIYS